MRQLDVTDINACGAVVDLPGVGVVPLLVLSCPPGPVADFLVPATVAAGLPPLTVSGGTLTMDRAAGDQWHLWISPGDRVTVDWPGPGHLVFDTSVGTPRGWCTSALDVGDCCLITCRDGGDWDYPQLSLEDLITAIAPDAALGFIPADPA